MVFFEVMEVVNPLLACGGAIFVQHSKRRARREREDRHERDVAWQKRREQERKAKLDPQEPSEDLVDADDASWFSIMGIPIMDWVRAGRNNGPNGIAIPPDKLAALLKRREKGEFKRKPPKVVTVKLTPPEPVKAKAAEKLYCTFCGSGNVWQDSGSGGYECGYCDNTWGGDWAYFQCVKPGCGWKSYDTKTGAGAGSYVACARCRSKVPWRARSMKPTVQAKTEKFQWKNFCSFCSWYAYSQEMIGNCPTCKRLTQCTYRYDGYDVLSSNATSPPAAPVVHSPGCTCARCVKNKDAKFRKTLELEAKKVETATLQSMPIFDSTNGGNYLGDQCSVTELDFKIATLRQEVERLARRKYS